MSSIERVKLNAETAKQAIQELKSEVRIGYCPLKNLTKSNACSYIL